MVDSKPEDDPNKLPKEKFNEVLKNSIIPTTDNNSSLMKTFTKWETIKTKVTNAKDIVKFTLVFNSNTSAKSSSSSSKNKEINIFHNKYDIIKQKEAYERKVNSIIYFSYRKNFDPIKNYKKIDDYLTSDCGWGCMIRSGQMILSRGLFRLFYYIEKSKIEKEFLNKELKEDLHLKARVKSILPLMEVPASQNDFCIKMKTLYYKDEDANAKKNINDNTIKVIPPFSIGTICSIGELYDKSAGEWFSDVTLPQIFNKINESFGIMPNLAIIHFNSMIELDSIISRCFIVENSTVQDLNHYGNNIIHSVSTKDVIEYKDKTYSLSRTGLIFVSVRLGLNTIPIEYQESIQRVFNCKQCIGIIGGKGSSAYYFIGHSKHSFLYLDPHLAQECTKDLGSETYEVKSVFQLPFPRMQTAFTIGFQFRSMKEYRDLTTFFLEESTKNKYPIFSYCEKSLMPMNFNHIDKDDNDF